MIAKTKTLIIITPGFAKDEEDQNCIPTQQLFIKCLNTIIPDLKVVILALSYPYKQKTYQWFGNTVISFNGRNRGGFIKLLIRRKVYRKLREINAQDKIVGILSFWYHECALIGNRFAKKNKLIHKCWMWGQDARPGNRYVRKVRIDGNDLVVLSDFLQQEFEKNYNIKPAHVIPPGIDKELFGYSDHKKGIDIIGTGSLIRLKRFEIFVEVIEKIKRQRENIKVLLVGDGPEKENLIALVKKLGLEQTISIAGELSHKELLKLMQQSKIFLHTSSYEGFGIVCIEALYAGCRIISFCKPMKQDIDNWQIANDKEEMYNMALSALDQQIVQTNELFPFLISNTVEKFVDLFHLK